MPLFPPSLPSLEISGRVPLNLSWSTPISTTIHVIVYTTVLLKTQERSSQVSQHEQTLRESMKSDPELLISIVSRRGNVSIRRLNVQICYVKRVVVCGFCLELSHGKVMYVSQLCMAISPNSKLFWPQQQHILPTDAGKIFLPPSSF